MYVRIKTRIYTSAPTVVHNIHAHARYINALERCVTTYKGDFIKNSIKIDGAVTMDIAIAV